MPLSSGTIKFISSLRLKKVRQNSHKFTAEGPRIVEECLEQNHYPVEHLYAVAEYADSLKNNLKVPLTVVTPRELERISQLKTPNRVVAVVGYPGAGRRLRPRLKNQWSLYLDGVQVPANLGALLRIAEWFGFDEVIGGPGTADLYNAKSVQASMGSFLRVNYQEADLDEVLEKFPGLPTFCGDLDGENVFAFRPPAAGILIVGAEGPGVSLRARQSVAGVLTVPAFPGNRAESLNVAVATGILCGALRNNLSRG